MPIYMDRHDLSEKITAEIVAELHRADLKVERRFGCRGLTYWFDRKRKTAFCLIEAPTKKYLEKMHRFAHGHVPNQIIKVDPQIVATFLGRIVAPRKAKKSILNIIDDSAFRTIMVIGLRLFLKKGVTQNEIKSKGINKMIPKILKEYKGTIVQQSGNHLLASFISVSKAVKAAVRVHRILGKDLARNGIELKIGLSAGVPVTDKKIFFGDSIKLVERMCKVIKGSIIISSEVKELYNSENLNPLIEGNNLFLLNQSDEKFLTLLMDYTESSWYNSNLKVNALSKVLGYSKSQLFRKMILLTGQSPNRFIKEYRLNEALTILNNNNRNVSEVAYETGFTSPSYFAKCFQKKFGFAPSHNFNAGINTSVN